ncbi:MAG: hypothetical protein NZL95_04270 [Chitinophagales bacterium]|nr:hypothetical protein [Chitinophagales bacterium]MDW8427746.1 OstA-like protein [Chitinophagales bacterium]
MAIVLNVLAILLPAHLGLAQSSTPVEIIHADEFEFFSLGGMKVRRLSGHVHLRQGDATLYCQRADYYLHENRIVASGQVHIIQSDTVHAHAEQLNYDGRTRQARLTGKVKLSDGHLTLYTDELDYDLNARQASYRTGGQVVSQESELTSRQARYHLPLRAVRFVHDVKLFHPDFFLQTDSLLFHTEKRICYFIAPVYMYNDSGSIYCRRGYYDLQREEALFADRAAMQQKGRRLNADSIYYYRPSAKLVAKRNVIWADSTAQLTVRAGLLSYEEKTDRFQAADHVLVSTTAGGDSLFVRSDTLWSFPNSNAGGRRLIAYPQVRLYSDGLQGVCDSLVYSAPDSTFYFYHNPVLWAEGYQLYADTIRLSLKDRRLHRLLLHQNAFAANAAGPDQYNQAKGKTITGHFREGRIDHMEIDGNGESIYHVYDDHNNYVGINRVACGSMLISFDTIGKVWRIFFRQQPEATLFPPAQLPPEESRLRQFVWKEALRPQRKEDLLP